MVRALRERADSVIVAVSRGKDSLAALDLAAKHFARVECYFMELVPGLSFVESYLGYLERRYSVKIERRPHWVLSQLLGDGTHRFLAHDVPTLKERDVVAAERARTGVLWHASGEKVADTLTRRIWLSKFKAAGTPGLNAKSHNAYPLAYWSDRQVRLYLKLHAVPLPADYRVFRRSWSTDLDGKTLHAMRAHFPEDYRKIEAVFPLVGAEVFRHEQRLRRGQEEAAPRPDAPDDADA